jgi:hypothetical protein
MSDQRWVLTYEHDGESPAEVVGRTVEVGESLLVGREADIPLGVDLKDVGISRVAAVVTATENGWQVEVRNRHHAMLHPWGQGPTLAGQHDTLTLTWPRIGIRILNGREADATDMRRHWLLLEADMSAQTLAGARTPETSMTSTARPRARRALTARTEQALRLVFADHLCWPPVPSPQAALLDTVARRLDRSVSAVQLRLQEAVRLANGFGFLRSCRLTDPEYVYVLVRAGYLERPAVELPRRRLD